MNTPATAHVKLSVRHRGTRTREDVRTVRTRQPVGAASCIPPTLPPNNCLHSGPCFRVGFWGNTKTENKAQRNKVISLGGDAWSVAEGIPYYYLTDYMVGCDVIMLVT